MFICKMIIESNDGLISFYSNDVARGGTTFQFSMRMEIGSKSKKQKRQKRLSDDAIVAIEAVEAVQVE